MWTLSSLATRVSQNSWRIWTTSSVLLGELAELVSTGDGSDGRPLSVYWSYSPRVEEFQQDLDDLGFAFGFDWGEWQDEAERRTMTPGPWTPPTSSRS
jgi:hypothetical protein